MKTYMKIKAMKRFAADFVYGAVALVVMNGVLSFLVYPFMEKVLGTAGQGKILFFTAIMGLMASACGSGANYARMKISTRSETVNGDYNWFLTGIAALACIVTAIAIWIKGDSAGATGVGIAVLIIATIIRYYADVQFRLDLNYKGFFIYYMVIAGGYLVGLFQFFVTKSWVTMLLLGEVAGLVYVTVRGSIFRRPFFKRSSQYKENRNVMISLSAAYLMSDFVSYSDRLLLPLLAVNGDEVTAIFYYATLVGKMVSLLSTPLNGVIAGHLAKYRGQLTKKMFSGIVGIMILLGILFTVGSVIGSHIFVGLFYPSNYEAARPLFWVANAGQVFFFLSNTMMTVVLRFASEKYQVYMGVIYTILFFIVVVPLLLNFGVWGMAYGLLIINLLKFLVITGLGYLGLMKGRRAVKSKVK